MTIAAVAIAALVMGAVSVAGAEVAGKKIVACDLLTAADLESVLGVTGIGPDTQIPTEDPSDCRYAWANYDAAGNLVSQGSASVGVGRVNATLNKDVKKNLKEEGFSKIPGVKKGFVNPDSGGAGAWILGTKGKQFASIQIFSEGVTKRQLVKLIKLVLKQL